MLFFYINDLLLNIVSNSASIYRDKHSILPKEVTEVLYNKLVCKSLYFLYPSNEVLLYAIP